MQLSKPDWLCGWVGFGGPGYSDRAMFVTLQRWQLGRLNTALFSQIGVYRFEPNFVKAIFVM
jgi:hypothetical protein